MFGSTSPGAVVDAVRYFLYWKRASDQVAKPRLRLVNGTHL